jgi:hypothetical protein
METLLMPSGLSGGRGRCAGERENNAGEDGGDEELVDEGVIHGSGEYSRRDAAGFVAVSKTAKKSAPIFAPTL